MMINDDDDDDGGGDDDDDGGGDGGDDDGDGDDGEMWARCKRRQTQECSSRTSGDSSKGSARIWKGPLLFNDQMMMMMMMMIMVMLMTPQIAGRLSKPTLTPLATLQWGTIQMICQKGNQVSSFIFSKLIACSRKWPD